MIDSIMFHHETRSLPKVIPQIFGLVYSVVWFAISCHLLAHIRKLTKPRTLFYARCIVVYHLSLELLFLSTYVQEGFYELASISLTVTYLSIIGLMTLIMVHMMEFSMPHYHRLRVNQMKDKFYVLLRIGMGVVSILGIACFLFARTMYFNRVLVALLLTNQFCSTAATVLCYKYTNEFLTKTRKDLPEDSDVIQRTKAMINTWVKLIGSVHIVPVTMVSLWFVYGYLPYQFVFCYGTLSVGTLSTVGLVSFFPRYSSDRQPPSPPPPNTQTNETDIANDTTLSLTHVTACIDSDTTLSLTHVTACIDSDTTLSLTHVTACIDSDVTQSLTHVTARIDSDSLSRRRTNSSSSNSYIDVHSIVRGLKSVSSPPVSESCYVDSARVFLRVVE